MGHSIFARMAVRSPGRSIYYKKTLGKLFAFVASKDGDTLEVTEAMPIWSKAPFMHIKKNVSVPTM